MSEFGKCVVCGTETPPLSAWSKDRHPKAGQYLHYDCEKCGNGMAVCPELSMTADEFESLMDMLNDRPN